MASVLEPEVHLAQRLASNEKPVRTKALKKLRKYVRVRSQDKAGAFSGDELLKLWKGLFYCLWMQDKPQLQEELSNQISTLIHSFQNIDGQLQYLESFLQTFTREWTSIDRLRMDKFYQLIRFMFRQTFEMLRRRDWENSVVSRFLELLSLRVLQSDAEVPSGLQLHILDVYLTELAAVGSAELTADQNLAFIEPFCRTAAKTKNRTLFGAICSNSFSTIIEQAPFAIEDLMKELEAAESMDSDSGRASEEDNELGEEKMKSRASNQKAVKKQINGKTSHEEKEEGEDDELLHLEHSDTEPLDDDVGSVLQFDYDALADKLLEFASRTSTPGQNRHRLYKIIKVLRDLSEGIFPQDDFPEEVSTDEDDDMFGSRKRMKRRRRAEDEEAPTGKKSKAEPGKTLPDVQNQSADPAGAAAKKHKKKKKGKGRCEKLDQGEPPQDVGKEVHPHTSTPSPDKTGADLPSETLSPVRTTEDKPKKKKKRRRRRRKAVSEGQEVSCAGGVMEKKKSAKADVSAVSNEASEAPPSRSEEQDPRSSAEPGPGPTEPGPGPTEPGPGPAEPGPGPTEPGPGPTEPGPGPAEPGPGPTEPGPGPAEPGPGPGLESVSDDAAVVRYASKKQQQKKSVKANEERRSDAQTASAPRKRRRKAPKDKAGALEDEVTMATPTKKKMAAQVKRLEAPELPSLQTSAGKTAKKKKKIPVTFEFDEAPGGTTEEEPADQSAGSSRLDLKKVTFGLKNNKTAEFRRTDRSLLLSPDGSSRVPFDPQQKPKFGVLKSPPTVFKKTPMKKTSSGHHSRKHRMLAADFF